MWEQDDESCFYFFRRLTIASTAIPSKMPAMMDSHGKPGIAGSTIGVETDIVVELLVVVGVLTTVIVETDVLTKVVVGELAVIDSVEELEVDVLTCEVLEVLALVALEVIEEDATDVELDITVLEVEVP